MLKPMLSPSMMCGSVAALSETLSCFAAAGIEYLHMDVMDGVFVPNFQYGTEAIRQFRSLSGIPLDIHLMITEPEKKLTWFDIRENEIVSIHAESTLHIQKCLSMIRSYGAKAFLALNPATPLVALEEVLPDCDGILLMTVNPGFAGQKLVPQTVDKVSRLRRYLEERGCSSVRIEVDGNVSFENARLLRKAGADIFVGGTSSVFRRDMTLSEGIGKLRASVADDTL